MRNNDTYADTYKSPNTTKRERNVGRERERSDGPVKIDGFDLAAGKHGCEFWIYYSDWERERERYEEQMQRYNMDR